MKPKPRDASKIELASLPIDVAVVNCTCLSVPNDSHVFKSLNMMVLLQLFRDL